MALKLPVGGGGGDFKRCPPGTHIAVCNLIADVGLQPGSGQFPTPKRKLYIRFEVPSERVEYERDGKKVEGPITIGQYFTASMHEKAQLRKQLEGWRGKKFSDDEAAEFDVGSILGKPCMLSIVETENGGKTYSNIASISALPKNVPAPKAENDLLYYDADNPTQYEALPQWLREKIDDQLSPPTSTQHERFTSDEAPW
jgi:hypothetical protein